MQHRRDRSGLARARPLPPAALGFLLVACVAREEMRIAAPIPAIPSPRDSPEAETLRGPLGPHDLIRLVLARNPDFALARARIDVAAAALDMAAATLWPRLALGAEYVRADQPSTFLFRQIDARRLPPSTDFNDPGTFDDVGVSGTVAWNLWNGGRDQLGVWSAEAELLSVQAGDSAIRNELVARAVEAFVDAQAALELIAADESSERAVQSQVNDTSVRVAGGSALRSDLKSLEARLGEARERHLRSDLARRVALATLRHLLVLPAEVDLELSSEAYQSLDLPDSLAAARADARASRPELAAARYAVERARLEVERAARAYWPRLDGFARIAGDDGDASLDFDHGNWSLGLALTFDAFDGGLRAADRRRAEGSLREAEESYRKACAELDLDVELCYLKLEEARARRAVAEQTLAAARESFDLVDTQYRGGSATVTRYLEAEAARTQASTALIRARLDVDRSAVEVARAMGRNLQ
ncbi:MAG: TolC family protein [Planctomycetota bacterium]